MIADIDVEYCNRRNAGIAGAFGATIVYPIDLGESGSRL